MTDPLVSSRMKRVRQKGTRPELVVRELLDDLGARYQTNRADLPGTPDIVDQDSSFAIFVNGCFWHIHSACGRGTIPKSNSEEWTVKFKANRLRDQMKIDALVELGFEVLVVWECELDQPEVVRERLRQFWFLRGDAQAPVGPEALDLFESKTAMDPSESHSFSPKLGRFTRHVRLREGRSVTTNIPAEDLSTSADRGAGFDAAWLRQPRRPKSRRSGELLRIADLFSGCGGMSIGLLEAARAVGRPAEIAFAADFDTEALEAYQLNLSPHHVEAGPIEAVLNGSFGSDPTVEEEELMSQVGKVEVLLGGPPCQGHSNLNNHTRRDDPKNELYERMARFAELFEPAHVVIENVPGVLHDKGGVFDRTRSQLEELGYDVDFGIVKGERIGVPQTRHRVFLVASRTVAVSLDDWLGMHAVPERPFDWACHDLSLSSRNGLMSVPTTSKQITLDRIDYLFNEEVFELPNDERPDCHRLKKHSYKAVYGRIHGTRPAPTITTGFTVMGQGRFVHPYQRRTLNPLEGARLQFFPDWYDFGDRPRGAYLRLIGNAVPPKMAYVLGLELLR